MKLLMQTVLSSLIIAKIVLGSIFLYQVEFAPLFTETVAIASEVQKDSKGLTKSAGKEPNRVLPALSAPAGKGVEGQAVEREQINLSLLKKRKAEINEKEKYLEKRQKQLVALQEEINKNIATLTRLRNEIKAEMTRKKAGEAQKLKHLIKIYSAMKPPKAASLIEKLDIKLSIEILSKMKGDTVGRILSFVDVGKAAKISEGLLKK
jgi:flagellar motility protein MotE (MotC chaperone)